MSSQAADRYPVSTGMAAESLAGNAPIPATAPDIAQNSSGEPPPSVWERSTLTGVWGGLRSQLADSGVTFDLDFTQFLQGAAISSGSREFNYGGRFDALINFDTEQLGLWEGGEFQYPPGTTVRQYSSIAVCPGSLLACQYRNRSSIGRLRKFSSVLALPIPAVGRCFAAHWQN